MKFFQAIGRIKLNQNECILVSLFLFASLVIFHRVYRVPHATQLAALQAKVIATQQKNEQNLKLLNTASERAPASKELQSIQHLLDQYLKSNTKLSDAVTGIISTSNSNEFLLSKITAEKQTKSKTYTQTFYTLDVEASFIAIGKFLEKLEDSTLLTEVQSIEITRIANEMQRCKASIKLVSYVMGAEK